MIQEFRIRPREQAAEMIECYIIDQQLRPHDRLPSEREMCEKWGFNRTTLRSAIANLILAGKIYNKKGAGTYVAPQKFNRNLQDLKSLAEVAHENGKELKTELLYLQKIECTKRISKALKLMIGNPVWEIFRLRIMDGEPVMLETSYSDAEKYHDLDQHDFSKESLYAVLRSYGAKMERGSEKIEITTASETEAEMLKIEEGMPLFYLTGVVCDDQNIPVEYFKSVVRSDQVRFMGKLLR